MPDAAYKGQTFDLDRVVFERDTTWDGRDFVAGATVRDVIKDMTGIGYGGHLYDSSDDEVDVYTAVARTPNEYRWIVATREAYCKSLEQMLTEAEVPKVWVQ